MNCNTYVLGGEHLHFTNNDIFISKKLELYEDNTTNIPFTNILISIEYDYESVMRNEDGIIEKIRSHYVYKSLSNYNSIKFFTKNILTDKVEVYELRTPSHVFIKNPKGIYNYFQIKKYPSLNEYKYSELIEIPRNVYDYYNKYTKDYVDRKDIVKYYLIGNYNGMCVTFRCFAKSHRYNEGYNVKDNNMGHRINIMRYLYYDNVIQEINMNFINKNI